MQRVVDLFVAFPAEDFSEGQVFSEAVAGVRVRIKGFCLLEEGPQHLCLTRRRRKLQEARYIPRHSIPLASPVFAPNFMEFSVPSQPPLQSLHPSHCIHLRVKSTYCVPGSRAGW